MGFSVFEKVQSLALRLRNEICAFGKHPVLPCALHHLKTLLEPQSRFGDTRLKIQVLCPPNGTAVLKRVTKKVPGRPKGQPLDQSHSGNVARVSVHAYSDSKDFPPVSCQGFSIS